MLREQLGAKRPKLSDAHRRRLAETLPLTITQGSSTEHVANGRLRWNDARAGLPQDPLSGTFFDESRGAGCD